MVCGFVAQFTGDSKVPYPWAAGPAAAFVLFFSTAQLFSLLLIRYSDGANYLVIILALVTPLVALFWTLFSYKSGIYWHPHFTLSTGFIIAGVVIITPCILLYNYVDILNDRKKITREATSEEYNNDQQSVTDPSVPA